MFTREMIRKEDGVLQLYDGYAWRKAKLCICNDCGKTWYIRGNRDNLGYCRDCLFKGTKNGMYGKTGWNKGILTYNRNEYNRDRKREVVALFGNKCKRCGAENLPIVTYTFHHINPKEKEFEISKILLWRWDKLKKELAKCVMLCANCHKVITFGDERLFEEGES